MKLLFCFDSIALSSCNKYQTHRHSHLLTSSRTCSVNEIHSVAHRISMRFNQNTIQLKTLWSSRWDYNGACTCYWVWVTFRIWSRTRQYYTKMSSNILYFFSLSLSKPCHVGSFFCRKKSTFLGLPSKSLTQTRF